MGLAGDEATRYDIPGEEGAWVKLFDLGFLDLNAAVAENQREARQAAREWGEAYETLLDRADRQSEKGTTKRQKVDPFTTHNTLVLLDRGVFEMHFPGRDRSLPDRSDDKRQQAERLAALGKLHPPTAEFIARQLLANANIDNAWGLDTKDDNPDVIDITGRRSEDDAPNPTRQLSSSRWTG